MFVSALTKDDLNDKIVDRILFEGLEDTGEDADCAIVLGSIKAAEYRLPVAVKAYRDNRLNKLILCGGKMRDFSEGSMTEARQMQFHAERLGVKQEDIMLDEHSLNTVENILQALLLLQRLCGLHRIHRVLLVTTTYHMRRSVCIARYLFPAHIVVIPCPADDTNTRRGNWMNNAEGRRRAYREVEKILESVQNGLFPDFEISLNDPFQSGEAAG